MEKVILSIFFAVALILGILAGILIFFQSYPDDAVVMGLKSLIFFFVCYCDRIDDDG